MEEYDLLFQIKRTQLEMLLDRGYNLYDEEAVIQPAFTRQNFIDFYRRRMTEGTFRDSLSAFYRHSQNSSDILYVAYVTVTPGAKKKEIKKKTITDHLTHMENNGSHNIIFVTNYKLNTNAREVFTLREGKDYIYKYQIFFDHQLRINPTKHFLYQKHTRVDDQDVDKVLAKLQTKLHLLPYIKTTDPVAKYFGWQVGSLIRIERRDLFLSTLTGLTIVHRVVIEEPEL